MKKAETGIVPYPSSIEIDTGRMQYAENKVERRLVPGEFSPESYDLVIDQDAIVIRAGDDAGIFYGERTLNQLLCQFGNDLPRMRIKDGPAFPYRSFHLDCARHFIPVDVLKKTISCAAEFKLNHFHWHFSDDQGYRIESERFPLLTEVASCRKGDHFGTHRDNTEEQYFYTKAEIRELVSFASEKHIEIVPEIDMPGHVTAILAAYPFLSCSGEKKEVATREGIYRDILCPGKEETFDFLSGLIDELTELFPGKYFHIGGDETPKKLWETCPYCRKRMEEEGLGNTRELQGYLQNRVADYLKSKGKTAIAWNESALGGNLSKDIILQLWNDDPDDPAMKAFRMKDKSGHPTSPNQGIGAKYIEAGGNVIMSNMLTSYCDYPPAFVKAKTIFDDPVLPQKCEGIRNTKEHVLGGEALCWTEHIRTEEELAEKIWPRYCVKAERLWSGPKMPDAGFSCFRKRLADIYPVFAACGITAPSTMKEAVPGPIESVKQMAQFMKNLGNNREDYKEAQKEV